MQKKPLVSIIIPVYNVQNYLEDCLNSVLQQTYKNIEIIIVDDGSTDNSPEILRKYNSIYKNILVVFQKKNAGQGRARNIGIEHANGKYILFVDADDFIEQEAINYLIKEIGEKDIDLIRFNAQSFSSGDQEIKRNNYEFSKYLKEEKTYFKSDFKNVYLSFVPSPVLYLFKKKIITKNKITFPENIIHEDEQFSAMIFFYSSNCIYVNKFFYNRRYRSGSTMTESTKTQKQKSFYAYVQIIDYYETFLENKKNSNNEKKFIKYRINSIFYLLEKSNLNSKQKQKLKEIKKNKIYYSVLYKIYVRLLKIKAILTK